MTDFPTDPPEELTPSPPPTDGFDASDAVEPAPSTDGPEPTETPPEGALVEEPSWNPLPPETTNAVPTVQASAPIGPVEPLATAWVEPTAPLLPADGLEWPGLPEQSFAPSFSRPELYDAWRTGQPEAQPEQPEPKRPRWRSFGVPFLAGLIGAGLALVGFLIFDDDAAPADPVASATPVVIREQVRTELVPSGDVALSADPAAVARKVLPSIVHVQVGNGNGGNNFAVAGSGSGVVLTDDGFIVTNNHVVENAADVQVVFGDGRIYQAQVVGTDPRTDLAVLDIDAEGLIAVEIGSAIDLAIGDVAIAAGNPLGLEGGPSLTVGVISAFGRQVTTGSGANDQLFGMLQTDAPITRGSSGGALVDVEGNLIGITSAVGVSDVGVEGIGFAIPIERVQRITDEIIANGSVDHSFLGITGITFLAEQPDGSQVPTGISIETFEDESAARDAGLEVGDVITELDGKTLATMQSLIAELLEHPVGDSVEVVVERSGEMVTVDILLGERPADLGQ